MNMSINGCNLVATAASIKYVHARTHANNNTREIGNFNLYTRRHYEYEMKRPENVFLKATAPFCAFYCPTATIEWFALARVSPMN